MATQVERFKYNAGTSGTVTVPSGRVVTGITAHATASGASMTIAAQGADTAADPAGDSIPIPAGTSISIPVPVIDDDIERLGPGTVIVFTGTDAYLVVYRLDRA